MQIPLTESDLLRLGRKGETLVPDLCSRLEYIPIYGDSCRFARTAEGPVAVRLPHEPANRQTAFLGVVNGVGLMACDLGGLSAEEAATAAGPGEFLTLRDAGPLATPTEGGMLALARSILFWHNRHRFCGACGTPTRSAHNGHVRICQNTDCGIEHHPRTDPAVIMLISARIDGEEKCLMGHTGRFHPGMYSTLAGFVEPGESLEAAVRREVFEEAGVKVGKVTYMASQPWPFPGSIMLGFHGEAETTDITIDPDELLDARWFSRDDIRRMPEEGLSLPSRVSISRYLIEAWMTGEGLES